MPSIEKRGENSYRLTVEVETGRSNERNRERRTVRMPEGLTPKKQKVWLQNEMYKFKTEVESGTYISPEKMTFATFVEEWKEKHAKGKYAPKTEAMNNFLLDMIIPYIGHIKLQDFKPIHIVNFFSDIQDPKKRITKNKKPFSQSIMASLHRILKNVFGVAVTWRLIPLSPMEGMKYPKMKKSRIDCYDAEEAKHLLEVLNNEPLVFQTVVSLALTTGLRRGEISGLEWKHVDLENGILDIQQQMIYTKDVQNQITQLKTPDAYRKVSVPQMTLDLLKELRKHTVKERNRLGSVWKGNKDYQLVFNTSTGNPYTPGYISMRWNNFVKKHNLRYVNFHALRHTSASLLINSGIHSKVISERLGHSNITVTMNTYGHVFQQAEEAAAKTFDNIFDVKSKKKKRTK